MATFNINQTIIAGVAEGLADYVFPVTLFSYVVPTKAVALGDTVIVPFANATSQSSDFTYAGGYSGEAGTITGKSITLDKVKYVPVKFTDSELAIMSPDALTRMGRQLGRRLGANVLSHSISSTITTANGFTNSGSVGFDLLTANFSSSAFSGGFAALDNAANVAAWPDGERAILADSTLWRSFFQNTTIFNAANFGDGGEAVQRGVLKTAFGFDPYKVGFTLPNSAHGIALTPGAVGFVNGYHGVPEEAKNTIIEAQEITLEGTGLKAGFYSYYDANKRTSWRIFDCMFGSGPLNGSAAAWIK